jgi:hypothetical protein
VPPAKPYDRGADVTRPDGEHTSWETPTGTVVMYAPTHAVPYYRIVWGNPQEGTTAADALTGRGRRLWPASS